MIYTELTRKAMRIAYEAHHGQYDKAGVPYIFHPIAVAQDLEDEISCCAALLHDVVEDTDITLEELALQFPGEVIDVLKLLTHKEDVPYFDYIAQISTHPIAVKVKLADLRHNSNPDRLLKLDEKAIERLKKYEKAMKMLNK